MSPPRPLPRAPVPVGEHARSEARPPRAATDLLRPKFLGVGAELARALLQAPPLASAPACTLWRVQAGFQPTPSTSSGRARAPKATAARERAGQARRHSSS